METLLAVRSQDTDDSIVEDRERVDIGRLLPGRRCKNAYHSCVLTSDQNVLLRTQVQVRKSYPQWMSARDIYMSHMPQSVHFRCPSLRNCDEQQMLFIAS